MVARIKILNYIERASQINIGNSHHYISYGVNLYSHTLYLSERIKKWF